MEAIGEKLRSSREEQGRSIEEVARETNIAKRYIVALEEENFDTFPGEPYLIGFLRTYSETLGLDPDEIVALYKSFKIQEQPLPMDELIQKPKRKKWWLIPVIVVVLGGIGAGIFILVPFTGQDNVAREEEAPEETETETVVETTGTVYEMKDEIIERRFLEGDTIQVLVNGNEYPLRIAGINRRLTLTGDSFGEVKLSVGEEDTFDLNKDANDDIKVYVQDIDTSADTPAVVVRFDKFIQSSRVASGEETEEEESSIFIDEEDAEATVETGEGEETTTVPGIGSTAFTSREQRSVTIIEAEERNAFTLDFIFRGYCMLRYLSNNNVREERYFHKGETFRLENVNTLRLWLSNAGACKARIAGVEVEFGRPGEVATKLIQWRQDDQTDQWNLTLEPVY